MPESDPANVEHRIAVWSSTGPRRLGCDSRQPFAYGPAVLAAKAAPGAAATATVAMRADAETRLASRRLVMRDME